MSDSWRTTGGSSDTPQSTTFTSINEQLMGTNSPSVDGTFENAAHRSPKYASDKRKRLPKKGSCEKCKARKVKCDRVEPVCGWCSRNGRSCVYTEKMRPGPRPELSNELEKKINHLEDTLLHLRRQFEDHRDSSRNIEDNPTPGVTSYPHLPRAPPSISMEFGSEPAPTPSRIEHIRLPTPSEPVSAFSMEIAPDLNHPKRPDSMNPSPWTFELSDQALPSYELLCSLVDLYFKHVNTWCPILDRNSTFDILFERTPPCEADRILFHAIVATTLRFSKDPQLTPSVRRQYCDISKQRVLFYGVENTSVKALQALVILSLDALGTSNGSKGWNYLALVAQSIPKLGLNVEKGFSFTGSSHPSFSTIQDVTLSQPTSWIEDEGRRRLFWMVYILDRYATVGTGFDFLIEERAMNRPLPCRYDLFSKNQPVETRWFRNPEHGFEGSINKPENLGSFSYHCEVMRIMSRVHDFLSHPIDINSSPEVERWQANYRELDRELDTWLFNLPDEYGKISQFCHSDPNSKISNWLILHAAYVTTVIRLHSAAAYPSVHSRIFKPSYNAMRRCLAAVVSLKEISLDVVNTGMLDLLGPAFAFSLWVAARLLFVDASIMDHDLDPDVGFFVTTLDQMGQYWPVAQTYTEILSRVLNEHQPLKQANGGKSFSRINKFAEMRNRALELRGLMSQTRHSVLSPTSTLIPGPNELEYLDVFEFFNYPRLRTKPSNNTPVTDRRNMPDERDMLNSRGIVDDRSSGIDGRTLSDRMILVDDFQSVNNGFFIRQYAAPDPSRDWLTLGRTENASVQ